MTVSTESSSENAAGFGHYRDAIQARLLASTPEQIERLGWDAGRIRAERRRRLHDLVAHAVEHSPFHARRLSSVDVGSLDPADLSSLPVMSKSEMMDNLDDVFTDRRLSADVVEGVLGATGHQPVPIHGEHIAMASGGSSGRRGVFVFDRAALVDFLAAVSRSLLARLQALGDPPPGGLPIALVAASSGVHATSAAPALSQGGAMPFRFHPVPATLPLPEIVARLQDLQAPALYGYPSLLVRLAAEQQAGRLDLHPLVVTSTSETLTPEARATIRDAFDAPVADTFGSTEGLVGSAPPDDPVLTFNSDMCIVELVDHDNRPVAPGTPSAKVLLTNLSNRVQPLIRYELHDSFTRQPDAPDHGHLRALVNGRTDDVLRYGEVTVHPLAVRSVMVKAPVIADYRVRQTPGGIDVDVVAVGTVDTGALRGQLVDALAAAGLPRPEVNVNEVPELERHRDTGKLCRFVALPTT